MTVIENPQTEKEKSGKCYLSAEMMSACAFCVQVQ